MPSLEMFIRVRDTRRIKKKMAKIPNLGTLAATFFCFFRKNRLKIQFSCQLKTPNLIL